MVDPAKAGETCFTPTPRGGGMSRYLICGSYFDLDDKYTPIKAIGTGAYGIVCSARMEAPDGPRNVAIKKIPRAFSNVEDSKRLLREIKLLKHFNHENIVRIVDIIRPRAYEDFDDVYIVSELMDSDLHQIIKSGQQLTDEHVQYFLYQILRALRYIHSANVIHRDLKPGNILINANCDTKICDFGLSRPIGSTPDQQKDIHMTLYVVTRWYRAPEVLLCDAYSKPIDIWSVGCILAELLGHRPLFPGENHWRQLPIIISIVGSPTEGEIAHLDNAKAKQFVRQLPQSTRVPFSKIFPRANPLAVDLLEKMLQFDPAKRCTIEEALDHPYIASLHDPNDEPICHAPFTFDTDLTNASTAHIKELVFREMMEFHPQHQKELLELMANEASKGKEAQAQKPSEKPSEKSSATP
eukprot:m51a1_g7727 putative mitogen-activated protein kinase (411) ;mRNA; f:154916-157005